MTGIAVIALAVVVVVMRGGGADALVPTPDLSQVEARVARAVKQAREQVLAQPDSAAAWGTCGIACHAHEFMHEAHACYREAARLDDREPRWPYLQAMTLQAIGGEVDAIIELFRRADALQPQWPSTLARIGDAHASVGRRNEAREAYEQAVQRFPQVAAIHRGLGQVLLQAGAVEEAVIRLEEADRLSGNDRATWVALSQAYGRLGHDADAERASKRVTAAGDATRLPDPAMYEVVTACVSMSRCLERAKLLQAQGDHAAALATAEVVLADTPHDAALGAIAASALMALQRPGEAVERLRMLVEINPGDEPTRTQLAMALMQSNRAEEALAQFQEAARLKPDRSDIRARVAMCLQHLGRNETAIREFEAAAALGPLGAQEEIYWGLTCYRAQQDAQAIIHFERSLALDPSQPDGHFNIGVCLERQGRTAEAIERYRHAVRLQPQHLALQALSRLGARP